MTSFEVNSSTTVGKKSLEALIEEIKNISMTTRVLVGVPEEGDNRQFSVEQWENRDRKLLAGRIGNAALAAIHDNGSPVRGIPARPFMRPGIAKAQKRIDRYFKAAAAASLDGDKSAMLRNLHLAGLAAQNSIRGVIRAGEGFAPLKRATLLSRSRRRAYAWFQLSRKEARGYTREGRSWLRKKRREEIMASFRPLIDTGEMLKSITYIVESE